MEDIKIDISDVHGLLRSSSVHHVQPSEVVWFRCYLLGFVLAKKNIFQPYIMVTRGCMATTYYGVWTVASVHCTMALFPQYL